MIVNRKPTVRRARRRRDAVATAASMAALVLALIVHAGDDVSGSGR